MVSVSRCAIEEVARLCTSDPCGACVLASSRGIAFSTADSELSSRAASESSGEMERLSLARTAEHSVAARPDGSAWNRSC